jgi:hypothetical protein
VVEQRDGQHVLVAVEHAVRLAYDDRVKELLAEDYFL